MNSILKASRYFLSQAKSAADGGGVWRTTDEGNKIFIETSGTVRGGGPNGPIISESKDGNKKMETTKRDIFSKWDELDEVKLSEIAKQPPKTEGGYRAKVKLPDGAKYFETTLNTGGETVVESGEDIKVGDIGIAIAQSSSKKVQFAFAHQVTKVYDREQYGKPGKKVFTKLLTPVPVAVLYGDNLNSDQSGSDR